MIYGQIGVTETSLCILQTIFINTACIQNVRLVGVCYVCWQGSRRSPRGPLKCFSHSRKTWAICIFQCPGVIHWRWLISDHQISYGYVIQHITRKKKKTRPMRSIDTNLFSLCPIVCQNPRFLCVRHKLSIMWTYTMRFKAAKLVSNDM